MPDYVSKDFLEDQAIPWNREERLDLYGKLADTPTVPCNRSRFDIVDNKKNTHVCIGVKPREASDTYDVYEVTTDPLSPYFVSLI